MQIRYLISLIICTLLLSSCNKEEEPIKEKNTVLIYLAANNNLAQEALENLDQIEQHLTNPEGNILVYLKIPNQTPTLYKIDVQTNGNKKSIIKKYNDHNSSDPAILKQVLADAQFAYPSEKLGLILWSHATAWIPAGVNSVKLKSFGEDNNSQMDIQELRNALPNNLEYIMFDACSMASIEVLYELKDKAKFFIVSPAEVIANGMPYHLIVNDLLKFTPNDYIHIAKQYFNYYNEKAGLYRSATVSVVDASLLSNLAQEVKQLLFTSSPLYGDYNRAQLQRMDFDRYGNPLIAFDMLDFFEQNFSSIHTQPLKKILTSCVAYKANTPSFNGYQIAKNSGLTCYVPSDLNEGYIHEYYRTLSWYEAAGISKLF